MILGQSYPLFDVGIWINHFLFEMVKVKHSFNSDKFIRIKNRFNFHTIGIHGYEGG